MGKKEKYDDYEGDGEEFVSLNVSADAKRTIVTIILLVIAVLFILGFFNAAGVLGAKMTSVLGLMFGWGKYLAPLVLVYMGIILLKRKVKTQFYVTKIVGMAIAFWGVLALLHLIPFDVEQFKTMVADGVGGGYTGYILAMFLVKFTGKIAGVVILLALMLIGLIVAFNVSLVGMGDRVPAMKRGEESGGFFGRKKDEVEEDEEEYDETEEDEEELDDEVDDEEFDDEDVIDDEEYIGEDIAQPEKDEQDDNIQQVIDEKGIDDHMATQPLEDIDWELPPLKLLKRGGDKAQGGDIKQQAQRIQETFKNFGISMELEDIVIGPTVTQYSFRPQSGVKLSRITALNADLALALAAHPIRIEAPIPGKSLVGIEVPNKSTAIVRIRSLINTDKFSESKKPLLLALGEDVNGDYAYEDLSIMPHLLVAGTTGSGKSVAINNILLSLLYKNSPEDLKLILVDPKRVELSLYKGIPHLLSDVIVENGKVVNALKWAVTEMERRYKLLQETGSKNLTSYKDKRRAGGKRTFTDPETGKRMTEDMENLPAIIIVIDELSDLMSSHGKEVEGVIVRLAQMSRAVGIHLILSTQRPSVEVITGLIKANMPTRIALKVNSSIDSRTILDTTGAEKLIGNGDMLYSGPNTSTPVRLQNPFVGEKEIEKVVNFIRRQAESLGAYDIDEEFDEDYNGGAQGITNLDFENDQSGGSESEDPIYEEAKKEVIAAGKASTSYIQRRLRIGYSRAARLMDELEENGIIGPQEGSKPRKLLVGGIDEDNMDEIDEV